ncbi:MAG: magnesium transporter CorA family protein [Culicoidibacterales bacterium]
MIDIYLTDIDDQNKLKQIDEFQKGSWIHLEAPTHEEIERISRKLAIPLDFLKDALDEEEVSRIDREDDATLIIVDYPYVEYDERDKIHVYQTRPIGMVITSDYVVTVCGEHTPIIDFFTSKRVREFYTYKHTRFALQFLSVISSFYIRYLMQIDRLTIEIEEQLRASMRNKEIYRLMALEKSLVYFATSLRSGQMILRKLTSGYYVKMYSEDQDLLDDVIIEIAQAIEMTEVYSNILSSMMDAFGSIISNNLNVVMKKLTSITILISLPTLITGFYGMNINGLPLATHDAGTLIVFIGMAILVIVLAIIFRRGNLL